MSPDHQQSRGRRRGLIVPVVIAVVAAAVAVTMGLSPLSGGTDDSAPAAQSPSPTSTTPTHPRTSSDVPSSAPVKVHPTPEESASPQQENPLRTLERRTPGDPMAMGKVDAPVVLINYSDFQCPYCGKFARETHPVLVQKFVQNGTLRIEWRDFPYLGEESVVAAHAARAAALQGKFWQFHDAVYANQPSVNSGKMDMEYFTDIAADLGLNTKKFRKDMKSDAVADRVHRDFLEGQALGVTGTPAFLINGEPMMGAQPTKVFVQAIKQAAAQADD